MPESKITHETKLRGSVRGMLFGIAFGDAVGAPVEKLLWREIAERYGRVETLDHAWHKNGLSPELRNHRMRGHGIVTDDTLMTFCLMEVYQEAHRHLDAWDMAAGMVRQIAWKRRWIPEMQRETMLIERLFYPEKWIFQRHQLAGCDPRLGGVGNMVNCGAAMYIAPVGIVNAADPRSAYDEAIAFASGHQESYGLEAAGVVAACIAAAAAPQAVLDDIFSAALDVAKDGTRAAIAAILDDVAQLKRDGADYEAVVERFHRTIARFSPSGDDIVRDASHAGRPTAAYTPSRCLSIEELPLALGFCAFNDGDFRKSILDGINSGRDTDSIGVLAGAILGALHGETVIVKDDLARLNEANRFDLLDLADVFSAAAESILRTDAERAVALQAARSALLGAVVSGEQIGAKNGD